MPQHYYGTGWGGGASGYGAGGGGLGGMGLAGFMGGPWGFGLSAVSNLLGGLFGGPSKQEKELMESQAFATRAGGALSRGQLRFLQASQPFRLRGLDLANMMSALQQQGLKQRMFQSGEGFKRAGETYGLARGQLGQQIYDPQQTLGMAMQQLAPRINQLMGKLHQTGFARGGVAQGALANLGYQQGLGHLMGGYERSAYQAAQRDMNLMRLMGGLFRG